MTDRDGQRGRESREYVLSTHYDDDDNADEEGKKGERKKLS